MRYSEKLEARKGRMYEYNGNADKQAPRRTIEIGRMTKLNKSQQTIYLYTAIGETNDSFVTGRRVRVGKMVERRTSYELGRMTEISPRRIPRNRRRSFHDVDRERKVDIITDAHRVKGEIEGRKDKKNRRGEFAEVDEDVASEVSGGEKLLLGRRECHDVGIDWTSKERQRQ